MTLTNVEISGNTADVEGGGLLIYEGVVTMTLTLIADNVAKQGRGDNVLNRAGELYYKLPTVAGYWLPNSL